MVSHIAKILGTRAPTSSDKACLDAACHEAEMDVSNGQLQREGLSSPPETKRSDDLDTLPESQEQPEVPAEIKHQLQFRSILNVVFNMFPFIDEADSDESHGEVGLAEVGKGPDVAFHSNTKSSRHADYLSFVVKAAAWIATALRRLPAGQQYVEKWFMTSGPRDLQKQLRVTRSHLLKMLSLTNFVMIKKGSDDVCTVEGSSGTMAYVMTSRYCVVESGRDCGEKTPEGRYIMNICEFYWHWGFGSDTHTGTIVHESSHHFGTKDYGYCEMVDCLKIEPKLARQNADTYTHLVEDLVKQRSLQEVDVFLPPSEGCNTQCGASSFESWDFKAALSKSQCGRCSTHFRLGGCPGRKYTASIGTVQVLCCDLVACEKVAKPEAPKSNSMFGGFWR
eukprot:SRR837773.5046.p1 GENE.SRR837773.5046~~SRR837773.5046.p1  ORF type:complete len:432 (-),score=114.28 SRR837773.5046:30-1208(-)